MPTKPQYIWDCTAQLVGRPHHYQTIGRQAAPGRSPNQGVMAITWPHTKTKENHIPETRVLSPTPRMSPSLVSPNPHAPPGAPIINGDGRAQPRFRHVAQAPSVTPPHRHNNHRGPHSPACPARLQTTKSIETYLAECPKQHSGGHGPPSSPDRKTTAGTDGKPMEKALPPNPHET